jgi:hypothetical protein
MMSSAITKPKTAVKKSMVNAVNRLPEKHDQSFGKEAEAGSVVGGLRPDAPDLDRSA